MSLSTGHAIFESEIYRLDGELLLDQGPENAEPAQSSFLRALEVARRQSAKSWELRAATSLARLWQSQGRNKDALDLLHLVYDWFTEGIGTRDLMIAKALLDILNKAP